MKVYMRNKVKGVVKGLLPLCLFTFLPFNLAAQDNMKTVTGTVADAATGNPLAGVIVTAYGDKRWNEAAILFGRLAKEFPGSARIGESRVPRAWSAFL